MTASIEMWAQGDLSDDVLLHRWKVERRMFSQVVVAIMRAYRRSESVPATAHAYNY